MEQISAVTIEVNETTTSENTSPALRGSYTDIFITALVLGTIFLLPLFVVPLVGVSFEDQKTLFVSLVAVLGAFAWCVRGLVIGHVVIPRSPLLLGVCAVGAVFAISALFSPAPQVSFSGFAFTIGTAGFMGAMMLLLFLSSSVFRSEERVVRAYVALLASFGVLALFHLLRLIFGPSFLSLGTFDSVTDTLIGKWNDVAIFAGLIAFLTLFALEFAVWSAAYTRLLYSILGVALVLLALVNFGLIWSLVALFSFVVFVYNLAFKQGNIARRRLAVPALFVLTLSVIFLLAGGLIHRILEPYTHISHIEVRPLWSSTMDLITETWKQDPILGVGPNRFVSQWLLYKNPAINETSVWAMDFHAGSGLIPSFSVTTGVLGALAWILFFAAFLYHGIRLLFASTRGHRMHHFASSSYIGAFYLWVVAFLYVPSAAMFALAFILTGISIAFGTLTGSVPIMRITSSFGHPRRRFIVIFFFAGLTVAMGAWGYAVSTKIVSAGYMHRAAVLVRDGFTDPARFEHFVVRAAEQNGSDLAYRQIVDAERYLMQVLLSQEAIASDEARQRFQTIAGNALSAAQAAIQVDPTNYKNWVALFSVYFDFARFGIFEDAHQYALAALTTAREHNPRDPRLFLYEANLAAVMKDYHAAREALAHALAQKSNYTDAIVALSVLESIDNDTSPASNISEEQLSQQKESFTASE